MLKGLYTASSSMLANQRKLNVISNNLANANTAGYKKDHAIQESFPEMMISLIEQGKEIKQLGSLGTGVRLQETALDLKQGPLNNTNNQLDFAIEGNGFFVISTPAGLRYTRNGNFTLNQAGQIVTKQGYLVMGQQGPMQTITGREIKVDESGQLYLGGINGDRFLIVDFPDGNQLRKIRDNLYQSSEEGEGLTTGYQLKQGYLENSNVNIIEEMVKMIETSRNFDSNQKVITAYDSSLDKVVNSVGKFA